jgi:hypothetical protein
MKGVPGVSAVLLVKEPGRFLLEPPDSFLRSSDTNDFCRHQQADETGDEVKGSAEYSMLLHQASLVLLRHKERCTKIQL